MGLRRNTDKRGDAGENLCNVFLSLIKGLIKV